MTMKKDGACPACGSRDVMLGVKLDDRTGHVPIRADATLSVERNPEAILFKEVSTTELKACVCAACGHVELYVLNPSGLWDAYRAARNRERR